MIQCFITFKYKFIKPAHSLNGKWIYKSTIKEDKVVPLLN
jgi:hypothetical protein